MKHLFRATKLGWNNEKEGVWFDSDYYTKEEAEAEFKPYEGTTQRGHSYTGYEYDGQNTMIINIWVSMRMTNCLIMMRNIGKVEIKREE